MDEMSRYFILCGFSLITMVVVYRTFVRALRKNNARNYELGSGRVFDAFTTDQGSWIFSMCVFASIVGSHWTIPLGEVWQDGGTYLFVFFCVSLIWTDCMLASHFNVYKNSRPELMTQGPYAIVRHPRYACWVGLLVSLSLALSSIFGLIAALLFSLLVIRRVKLEDHFLMGLYGERYRLYAKRTARLVPLIW